MSNCWQKQFLAAVTDHQTLPELVEFIKPIADLTASDVITIYQSDYRARLMEALGKNYEGCWLLLGDDDFHTLGNEYISQTPSEATNLTAYGASWPEFLERYEIPDEVSQMATFERAFWKKFHQKDVYPKDIQLSNVVSLHFDLSQIDLLQADFKLYQLWLKRETTEQQSLEDFLGTQRLVLFRAEDRVKALELTEVQFVILSLLKDNGRLDNVFEQLEARSIESSQQDWTEIFGILQYCLD